MRAFWVAVLLSSLSVLLGAKALACSCTGYLSEYEGFRETRVIFEGVAISTETVEETELVARSQSSSWLDRQRTIFKVSRTLKGSPLEERVIYHSKEFGGNCGYEFSVGEAYRIYSYGSIDKLRTGSCTGTGVVGEDSDYSKSLIDEGIEKVTSKDEYERDYGVFLIWAGVSEHDFQVFLGDYQRRFEAVYNKRSNTSMAKLVRIGDYAREWNDVERQIDVYTYMSEVFPDDALGYLSLGETLFKDHREEEALAPLRIAARLDPRDLLTARLLAKSQFSVTVTIDRSVRDYSGVTVERKGLASLVANEKDFSRSTLSDVSFVGAKLHNSTFAYSEGAGVDFTDAHLEHANFSQSRIAQYSETGSTSFSRARLKGASLRHSQFEGVSFNQADLSDVDAGKANLGESDFRSARFAGGDFSHANFRKATFRGTSLRGGRFQSANFNGVDLLDADLADGDFKDTDFTGARINCGTRIPSDSNAVTTWMIPIQPDCDGVPQNRTFPDGNWSYLDLMDLNLRNADFSGGQFKDVEFDGSDLSGADFSDTDGKYTSFSGANLSGASFRNAKQVGYLNGVADDRSGKPDRGPALLSGTDFSGAHLTARSFTSLYMDLPNLPDLGEAKFENITFKCEHRWRLKSLNLDYEAVAIEDNEFMLDVEPERRKEIAEAHRKRFERNKTVAGHEVALVRFFLQSWPETKFEECKKHLELIASE